MLRRLLPLDARYSWRFSMRGEAPPSPRLMPPPGPPLHTGRRLMHREAIDCARVDTAAARRQRGRKNPGWRQRQAWAGQGHCAKGSAKRCAGAGETAEIEIQQERGGDVAECDAQCNTSRGGQRGRGGSAQVNSNRRAGCQHPEPACSPSQVVGERADSKAGGKSSTRARQFRRRSQSHPIPYRPICPSATAGGQSPPWAPQN